MKIQQLTVAEALASLRSSPGGLSSGEAARRLGEYGANEVEKRAQLHWGWLLARQFTHFFALLLWLAAGMALLAHVLHPGQGMITIAAAIIVVILVNGLFSFWQEYRAEKTLAALSRLLPRRAKVLRDGGVEVLPAEALVPGDVLLLEQGDLIPADCRLIEAFGVRVNNATVTGEALPQARHVNAVAEDELVHAANMLLAGTTLVGGSARALVAATGAHTEFGRIAHLTQAEREPVSPLQRETLHLSRWIALLSVLMGTVFFLVSHEMGLSYWDSFLFAIGIIVANVPEGLLPEVTLALAMATQRMARRNALIRHLPAVETLGATTVICTDKTGTLTLNRMSVHEIYLDGRTYMPSALSAQPALLAAHREFLSAARLCHGTIADESGVRLGDPTDVALLDMAQALAPEQGTVPLLEEIPFDATRMRQSTVHGTAAGDVLYSKGALETLLPLCSGVHTGTGASPLTTEARTRLLEIQVEMASRGLRVLALAYRYLPQGWRQEELESSLTLSALVGLEDPPRPEVAGAIRTCREAGIRVIMITGDHPRTALAVAREIGLVHSAAPMLIIGEQLRRLSDTQLQLALDAQEIVFARVLADQKLRVVQALKRKREIVAVTGDGVNDAPALRAAHIGIAMGMTGSDVAKEAADMVLLDDNFAGIVAAVEEGRAVYANLRKFLTYILTSNIPELAAYLAFSLLRVPLPLTVVQMLSIDLGTNILPALGLGAEQPEAGLMARPPRSRRERLFHLPLLLRAYLFLGLFEAAAALGAYFFVLYAGGWHWDETLLARDPLHLRAATACLAAIIVMQMVNVFLCRSPSLSILTIGLRGNRLLLAGVGLEIALVAAYVYTPWGQALLGTAPLDASVWLSLLPFALAMLAGEELRKLWQRRSERRRGRALTPPASARPHPTPPRSR